MSILYLIPKLRHSRSSVVEISKPWRVPFVGRLARVGGSPGNYVIKISSESDTLPKPDASGHTSRLWYLHNQTSTRSKFRCGGWYNDIELYFWRFARKNELPQDTCALLARSDTVSRSEAGLSIVFCRMELTWAWKCTSWLVGRFHDMQATINIYVPVDQPHRFLGTEGGRVSTGADCNSSRPAKFICGTQRYYSLSAFCPYDLKNRAELN
jgi:hypothetical protein